MTCYVMDTDYLSLYERAHPQVCARIIQIRQNSSALKFQG
jgi:tRNA(fMet)-specific endonuclease VapC